MASKAPPPLIRSSKAFSVEIPEGSNSAKSRRSDIVANDDLDIHAKSSNFQSQDHSQSSSHGLHEDGLSDSGSAFAEDHAALGNVNVNDHQDGLKDRFAHEQEDKALSKNSGIAKDALKDNLQGVGNEAIKDNLQGVGNEAIKDNLQGVANEALQDNKAGIAKDAIKDKLQGVGNEALHDTKVGIPDSHEDAQQHAGVAKDAIKDNLQGVDNDAIKDNLQGLANEALHDNNAGIAKDAERDNKAGIAKDAIEEHQQGVGKEHVEDHIAQLPGTAHALKDGPNPGPHQSDAPAHHEAAEASGAALKKNPKLSDHTPSSAEHAADRAQALLHAQQEKAKKMEEFHGRVEAIRKTVSGINHKLDDLDEEGLPLKP